MTDVDTVDTNDLIGFAIPGYALIILVVVLFRNYSPLSNLISGIGPLTLAGLVAVSGLPIGFVWVTLIYHPFLWKRTPIVRRDNKNWNDFCVHIMNGLDSKRISALTDRTKIALAERFFANLRETNSLVTFYHFRHHTVRDFGFVVLTVTGFRFILDVLRWHVGTVIPWFTLLAIITWVFCVYSAHALFQTTKQHLSFLTAQLKPELVGSVRKTMTRPFDREFL